MANETGPGAGRPGDGVIETFRRWERELHPAPDPASGRREVKTLLIVLTLTFLVLVGVCVGLYSAVP